MSHVLVVSSDPIGPRMAGPAIRALEIARALASSDLEVLLAASDGDSRESFAPGVRLVAFDTRGEALREAASDASAIVVGGLTLARYPFLASSDVPLVLDLYAPFVLENLPAGAAGGRSAAGRRRRHAGDVEALTWQMQRGDFFICASETQRDFWLGGLTALGRVNPVTYADDPELRRLIDVVPFGVQEEPPRAGPAVLRGVVPGIGEGDRIVLWGGGLWDWLDPQTLVRAVASVARERDDVRLVFMGVRSPGPDVPPMAAAGETWELARSLGLLDSVVFMLEGWVPYEQRGAYLLEADIGASLHRRHIETHFAFRTRVLDYVWAGLPMVLTEGDVLSEQVEVHDLGVLVRPGDSAAVADAIWSLLERPGGRVGFQPRFEELRGELTWSRAVEPLRRFVAEPHRAPDLSGSSEGTDGLQPTPLGALPGRALEALRDGGPWLLLEETARYLRWRRRPQ